MTELSDYRRIVEKPAIARYETTIRGQAVEIERLRALLKRLFLLTMTSNDIRPDAAVLKEVGQTLAAYEQEARTE
jgi:hypothetical protein